MLLQTILVISLLISLMAGGAVYAALLGLHRRAADGAPNRVDREVSAPTRKVSHGGCGNLRAAADEIGRIEEELGRMQWARSAPGAAIARAGWPRLGEAVAKISHDLRNMLASAQMASERLATSGDPKVAKALPRLERALDRALSLAQNVLNYGWPQRRTRAGGAAHRLLRSGDRGGGRRTWACRPDGVRLEMEVGPRLQVESDPEQLHRILLNLMRNAREAIESTPDRGGVGVLKISARKEDPQTVLRGVADDGPGLSEKARQRFVPAVRGEVAHRGAAGLGLAISRELAQANGGDLDLVDSGRGRHDVRDQAAVGRDRCEADLRIAGSSRMKTKSASRRD